MAVRHGQVHEEDIEAWLAVKADHEVAPGPQPVRDGEADPVCRACDHGAERSGRRHAVAQRTASAGWSLSSGSVATSGA